MGHPDGLRIKVLGPALPSGMVTEANFQVTGYSGANISSDRIVNDAMLKGRFPVVILTTNSAVEAATGDVTFENILFVGSGSNNGIGTTGGLVKGTNVAVHNYAYGYLVDGNGMIDVDGCTASGNTIDGFNITFSGTIKNTSGVSSGNNGAGYATSIGGTIQAPNAVAKGNGDAEKGGFFASLAGNIQARAAVAKNNAGSGFLITNDGFIQARIVVEQQWRLRLFDLQRRPPQRGGIDIGQQHVRRLPGLEFRRHDDHRLRRDGVHFAGRQHHRQRQRLHRELRFP
jgi:hypothetical protein